MKLTFVASLAFCAFSAEAARTHAHSHTMLMPEETHPMYLAQDSKDKENKVIEVEQNQKVLEVPYNHVVQEVPAFNASNLTWVRASGPGASTTTVQKVI